MLQVVWNGEKRRENFQLGKLKIFIGMDLKNIILKEKKYLFLRKRYPRFQNKRSGTCTECDSIFGAGAKK